MASFYNRLFFIVLLLSATKQVHAALITGTVLDVKTREPLIGASVVVKELSNTGALVSLSGKFKLSISTPGKYTLVCSFIGYKQNERFITITNEESLLVDFNLEENANELSEIVVRGQRDKTSDEFALHTERNAAGIVNVMSAKTIQLMPDITVAGILQRFSGVSVDRNSSGDAQYAIIRGMPQRYNYTLVNGVKIPSPDNQSRYVPMDLFPADLLDRLEVIKTFTPSMEGDATGGSMNLVMKDAPSTFTVSANAATGVNTNAVQNGFSTYSGWQHKAPVETHTPEYIATSNDFSYKNFDYHNVTPINKIYGFSIGDRLTKDKKLGAVFAGSMQDLYRSTASTFFQPNVQPGPDNTPYFDDILIRQYSNHQKRYGLHVKSDYRFNEKHQLKLYGMFVELDEVQRRHTIDTSLSIGRNGPGTGNTYLLDRSRVQQQSIFNSTLQGDHWLSASLKFDWSAVFSKATNAVPDWSEYQTSQQVGYDNTGKQVILTPQVLYSFKRIWLANSDVDYTGYLNLVYNKSVGGHNLEISGGGLYRDKTRNNTYFIYNLIPTTTNGRPPEFLNGISMLSPDQWQFNGANAASGSAVNPNTYVSHEKIAAGYLQGKALLSKRIEIVGGVRAEHTYQDYQTAMPLTFPARSGSKSYLDILPSINFKYRVTPDQNIRASYFKSLNRPGFFEIIPTNMPGDYYNESGNPYLKHATIDNVDLRYEHFSATLDRLLIGVFYKHLTNPIETIWRKDSTSTSGSVIGPGNFGSGRNFGFELAFTKYWNRFGVSGNYTYTNSIITTPKLYYQANYTTSVVNQSRPLQGQSPHIANLSLLYKNVDNGLSLQLAMVYTGKRISQLSPYYNLDYYQQPLFTIDFSMEKRLGSHFFFYIKIQNILNTPFLVYLPHTNIYTSGPIALPDQHDASKILVQREYYGQNFIGGLRFKFSK